MIDHRPRQPRDYADTLADGSDSEGVFVLDALPEPMSPDGTSGPVLLALAKVHSELRQLREVDADLLLLDSLGQPVSKPARMVLADEWMRHRGRVTDALVGLDAALARRGEGDA